LPTADAKGTQRGQSVTALSPLQIAIAPEEPIAPPNDAWKQAVAKVRKRLEKRLVRAYGFSLGFV
jgi:hypothetical protein